MLIAKPYLNNSFSPYLRNARRFCLLYTMRKSLLYYNLSPVSFLSFLYNLEVGAWAVHAEFSLYCVSTATSLFKEEASWNLRIIQLVEILSLFLLSSKHKNLYNCVLIVSQTIQVSIMMF